MMNKLSAILLATAVFFPLFAKHDSAYLNKVSREYVTPHYKFQQKNDSSLIKPLFILMRSGARDAVEVVQRMNMDASHFLVYGRFIFAHEDMYESTHEGTSAFEKEKELSETLSREYDVYIIGQFEFTKLPKMAQFQILNAVRNGKSLIVVKSGKVGRLPYRKLYENPIDLPKELRTFSKPGNRSLVQAYQMGKGKFITVSWGVQENIVGRSILPKIPYSNQWKTQHENSAAFFALLCRYAAGRDLAVRNPEVRIRDAWNKDVTGVKPLPGGVYYKDLIGDNGSFHVEEFKVASPVGQVKITLPDSADKKKPVSGSAEIERPSKEPMIMTVELYDSPYGRIWHRQDVNVPAGAKKVDFILKDYYMPTLAGYLRLTFKGRDNKLKNVTDRLIFFPDRSLEDYRQIGWDGVNDVMGELLAPQMIERFGWNLMLSHPTNKGENARVAAMLNMKFVPYMVRIGIMKSPIGGVKQQWFFLPSKFRQDLKAVEGDECFYRPEVKRLWAEGIKHRIQNLPMYSAAIYNLGDENGLDEESCYGPSDDKYFREFLKQKYKTIENLNYNYRSNYRSFDEVPHLKLADAKKSGNFPAWRDHRAYVEKMYADIHAFLRDEIRKYDPGAVVGAEGSEPGDLELTMGPLEFWGPYSNLVGDELLRSFGPEKIRSLWWGGYPGSHSGRGEHVIPLNKDLLLGSVNGNAWFSCHPGSNHGSFACDFSIPAYVKNYLADLDRLKDGTAQLMIRNSMDFTGVSFYWSHPSTAAAYLDKRCVNPHDGLPSLIRAAYRTGFGFEFVSERTLDRLKNTKLLIMCGASALSRKECDAILEYVKQGGVVIADFNPAIMNENLRIMESNPLKDLFGDVTFRTAEESVFKPLKLQGFAAERVPQGKRVFTERRYGKGKAILCNFSFASACNTAKPAGSFDQWILSLLKKYGAEPGIAVGKVEETTMVRIRRNNDFFLVGVMQLAQHLDKPVEIDLKGSYHVYEADGTYLGKRSSIRAEFKKSPLQLFSVFREKQSAPEFGVANGTKGAFLKFRLPALKNGRVYRLELRDPSGKEVYQCVFDRQEIAPARAIAYTEQSGTWKAILTDIATGLSTTRKFEVK
ncbi:MAG: beta-galactosidase [Lentisphaeria bacterium]|nr:beta-galactosidase [Lentisphaeria bacterium]MBQ7404681.1 beta-galactosidase [Lentisphaeria bacterium]